MKQLLIICSLFLSAGLFANEDYSFVKGMYGTEKAREIGDLVTIVISETSSSSKSESNTTDKSATATLVQPFNSNSPSKITRLLNEAATFHKATIDSKSAFSGTGDTSSSDSLTATITARVVDKLNNGTLVVRGTRKVMMRKESVHLVITGTIRVKDVSKTNQINSSLIADAHIYYETDGVISKGSRPGFLFRLFQKINPF